MISAPGFHDVRAIVFDHDDTLYAKHGCMLSGIDAKARSWLNVPVLACALGVPCAGTAEGSDLMRARLLHLPACCRCRWPVGQ